MKRCFVLFMFCVITAFMFTGCGDNGCWYPINGGFINLKNVKNISSECYVEASRSAIIRTPGKVAITEKNIKEYKKALKKIDGEVYYFAEATIYFDDFKLVLTCYRGKDKNAAEEAIDSWLDTMDEIKARLPQK